MPFPFTFTYTFSDTIYELFYIVNAVNIDIMGYIADFRLERELEKLLDKLTFKVSRRIDDVTNFSGFDPNVEILLKFKGIGIFRGRCKTSDKKNIYTVEAYSSAEILSRKKAGKIYENMTPEAIFIDLVNSYSDLTPVTASSGTTIERLVADEYVSSIITKLSEALGWSIWSDSSKNIYFRPRGNTTNATAIRRRTAANGGSNAIFGEWKRDHNEMCNDVSVTGDNLNYTTKETFAGDGSTREFHITEQPIDIKISIGGVEQATGSYTVYAETKKILLNTVPSNEASIVVDYSYTQPIFVNRIDSTSISAYGTFAKMFFHKWIKTRADAIQYANNYISTYKNPLLSNDLIMNASYITTFNPGEQVQIIDDLESINANYVINKIKLEYLKSRIELNIGSYIPFYINAQGSMQDRIKELEKNLSKSTIQLYNSQSDTLSPQETLTESSISYINMKTQVSNPAKCDFGRGTSNDARCGLCQS